MGKLLNGSIARLLNDNKKTSWYNGIFFSEICYQATKMKKSSINAG